MPHQTTNDARFSEVPQRLVRIAGFLLGVLGLVLVFVGGVLSVVGFGLAWRMRS